MFGWFKPTCPVDLHSKIWVESRLPWIFEQFGTERILAAPRILPTREFFPDEFHGTRKCIEPVFERVCQYMGADRSRFELKFFSEHNVPDVLGQYKLSRGGKPTIYLRDETVDKESPDQELVIATLAHEVAHDLLLGSGRLTGDESDHEHLTDLLPVALGMGTFLANTRIKQRSGHIGNYSYWSIHKAGYITGAVCGYAMGVIEWLRNNPSPSELYLARDAAETMRTGVRYLTRTHDCLIDRSRPARPIEPPTVESLVATANSAVSPSVRLYTLTTWDRPVTVTQAETLTNCLTHKEHEVQIAAVRLLSQYTEPTGHVIDAVMELFRSTHPKVRQAAIEAIGTMQIPLTHVTTDGDPLLQILIWQARSDIYEDRVAAAIALGTYGPAAESAVNQIVSVLIKSLALNDGNSTRLFKSLGQIVGDLSTFIEQEFDSLPEGQGQLLQDGLVSFKREAADANPPAE
jgi:hypothetical protein